MAMIQLVGTGADSTPVSNCFFDFYMPRADGEFVKIYLLLWRYFTAGRSIEIGTVADLLEDTERDVLRGIRYWEKQGLLSCQTNDKGELIRIHFLPQIGEEMVAAKEVLPEEGTVHPQETELLPKKDKREKKEERKVSPDLHKQLALDEDFGTLLAITGKYLNRPLKQTDSDKMEYLYGTLRMSSELLEYLVETCVDGGHTSIHYIEKIALDWHKKGIRTVEQAKEQADLSRKQYYQILREFGITARGPAPEERQWMDRWLYEYGFTLEIILEACRRTIRVTHGPSFEYCNGILAGWNKQGVKGLSDIAALDEAHQKRKAAGQNTAGKSKTGKNRFHNYEETGYDYDQILAELDR